MMEFALISMTAIAVVMAMALFGSFVVYSRQEKDFALLQGTCDTWRETATRRADELAEAWAKLRELHDALYQDSFEASHSTHKDAVERAKRLAVIDVKPDAAAIQGKYDELRDAINEVSPGDADHDNHGMLLGRLNGLLSLIQTARCRHEEIRRLQYDRGSWRALRREIADCCGQSVPEDQEPPNHSECVVMLRELQAQSEILRGLLIEAQEMLQKYADASAAFSAIVAGENPDPQTVQINRGDMVFYCPCGKVLPGDSFCNCDACCKSRTSHKAPEFHNGPDHSEPFSPAMGVGEKVAEAMQQQKPEVSINPGETLFAFGCGRTVSRKTCLGSEKPSCHCEQCESARSALLASLIPTADSIENAILHEINQGMDQAFAEGCVSGSGHSLPADFAIDSVLASAEARSNSYG